MTHAPLAGFALALLAAASLAGCNRSEPAKNVVDTGKIAEAITADQAQFITDFNAHDAAKAVSHETDDFVGMVHGSANVVGAAADLADTQKAMAADATAHIVVSDPVITVAASGDMAVYRVSYTFTGHDAKKGKPITETGNYIAGYKPGADGTWKIAWSVVSNTGPPPPGRRRRRAKSQKRGGNSAWPRTNTDRPRFRQRPSKSSPPDPLHIPRRVAIVVTNTIVRQSNWRLARSPSDRRDRSPSNRIPLIGAGSGRHSPAVRSHSAASRALGVW